MALIGINNVQAAPTKEKKDLMDQISQGVGIAANILGVGLKGYEAFGPHADYEASQTERNNQLSKLYEAQAAAKPAETQAKVDSANNKIVLHDMVSSDRDRQRSDTNFYKAKADLGSLRGDPGLQLARRNLLLSENVISAAKPYLNDLNNIPQSGVTTIDIESGKLQSGGVPSKEELAGISDHTLLADAQKLKAQLMNAPQGAGQAAFIPNKLRYANEIKENSLNIIRRTYERKLKDWKSRISDADYNALKSNMDEELAAFRENNLPITSDANGNAVIVANPMVSVISPEGVSGQIPANKLNEALQRGFKKQ